MKGIRLIKNNILMVLLLSIATLSYAGSPVWTFTPLTATTISVPSNNTGTVQYTVTNQSSRTHTLAMQPITGVSQNMSSGYCGNPFTLGYHQSCVLNLTINGSLIPSYFSEGPVVCQQGNSLQCYQPNTPDILTVTKTEATYTVGGTVNGLSGTLVLENNGSDSLTLTADGTFTFPTTELTGASYSVTVQTQPTTQTCTVSNGSGTISNSNITNVTVTCSTNTHTVGGTTSGLAGSESVVLQNNGGDNLTVNANGSFTFAASVAQGSTYNVTVLIQPSTQTCTVTNGSGTISTSDVTNVLVTCSTNAYTVGGTLSGLAGSHSVVLQDNGTDNLTLSSNGSFTFATSVAQGSPYNVTVLTQPTIQTCTVTNGSGTMGGANVTNVSVSCVTNTTTLSTSVSSLALSKTGYTEYGVSGTPSSGVARTITVNNAGAYPAVNLSIAYPTWPSGTNASSTCGSSLAASSSCTITITPGNTATSDGTNPCTTTGTAPVAQTISISADNASTVSSTAVILGYGCIMQGGYIYAFDDTTSASTSVGGKAATTSNQSSGIIWASNGSGGTSNIAIYGISETSTTSSPNPSSGQVTGQTACNGNIDGSCDSNNIYVYYQTTATNNPINTSLYATGLCKATISGFSNWYLPAICEMGYGTSASCGTSGTPTLQNMQSNLVDTLSLLSGDYWCSTEYSGFPTTIAWFQFFASGGGSKQNYANKNFSTFAVRCSRALTL